MTSMGGHLAPELKYAGYDAVVIKGQASRPGLILIDDDRVEIRDADPYWGMGALSAEKALKGRLGQGFQMAVIGPAGENLVNYACLSHDFGRRGGRAGIAAVLGSKKIKAIAVRGSRSIPLADPRGVLRKGRELYQACFEKSGYKEWNPFGTGDATSWVNEVGAFPTRNFRTSYFDQVADINGQAAPGRTVLTSRSCFGCPVPCGEYSCLRLGDREFCLEGPKYQTLALMGGNLGLGRFEEVAYANYFADELGLDTISAGNVSRAILPAVYSTGPRAEKDTGLFGDNGSGVAGIRTRAMGASRVTLPFVRILSMNFRLEQGVQLEPRAELKPGYSAPEIPAYPDETFESVCPQSRVESGPWANVRKRRFF